MKYIQVKNQFEFFHKWENAPKEVEFLRNLHRHMFYVKTFITVDENDRELEFFMVQRDIEAIITNLKKDLPETSSCEDMAEYILDCLEAGKNYKNRLIQVFVSEDEENGSGVDNSERYANI